MPLAQLTNEEKIVVFECLKCVASGDVIMHDSEFQTIMGIEVKELLAVLDKWPEVDDSDETVFLAINNSMNNLLGYPHGKDAGWSEVMSVPLSEIARIFRKWRGDNVDSYFDGLA